MIHLPLISRRSVLILVVCTIAAAWEAPALAGDHICSWTTYGSQRSDDAIRVTFYVYVTVPMPHYVPDTTIDPVYLDYVTSTLLIEPAFYANLYVKVASGFVAGKNYKAEYDLYEGGTWVNKGAETWTQE